MELAYAACVLLSLMAVQVSGQDQGVSFEVKILPDQRPYSINLDEHLFLTCEYGGIDSAMGGETPTLQWFAEDQEITGTNPAQRIYTQSLGGNLLLHINNIEDEDSGQYKCVGTLGGQTDEASIDVRVQRKLEFISKPKQFGIFGQDGTLKCEATGKPSPTLVWYFENRTEIKNSDRYILGSGMLTIKSLTLEDDQEYQCLGLLTQSGVAKSLFIDFTVAKPPKIGEVLGIQPNNPKVGDEVSITCTSEGVPRPRITFKKNGNTVPAEMINDGVLYIESLVQEDEAEYTCLAENVGGLDQKSTYLDVKVPPTVKIEIMTSSSDAGDPVEGQSVSVKCSAEGDPRPDIKWKKLDMSSFYDDGIQGEDGPRFETDTGSDPSEAPIKRTAKTMIFDEIQHQNAGKYACFAINVVGEVTEETEISIRYAPSFETDFKDSTFYGWKGHQANLTCMTTANPSPTYKWYKASKDDPTKKESEIVNNQGPFTIATQQTWDEYKLSSSSLLVNMLDPDSLYGHYICEASNFVSSGVDGTQQHVVELKQATPPKAPVVAKGPVLTTMATLVFRPPADNGGQKVLSYSYEYHPDGQEDQVMTGSKDITGSETRVELTNLQMRTNYVIKVRARNAVGLGEQARITLETKSRSPPLRLVLKSDKEGSDDDTYTIVWEKPEDGEDPITEFNVEYSKVQVIIDGDEWEVEKTLEGEQNAPPLVGSNHLRYVLRGLDKDSFYRISVTAKNGQGTSDPAVMVIKTSKGNTEPMWEEDETEEEMENAGEGEEEGTEISDVFEEEEDESESNSTLTDTIKASDDPAGRVGDSGYTVSGNLATILLLCLACLMAL